MSSNTLLFVNPAEDLFYRFIEGYSQKPVNTDSINFINCNNCNLCLPKFCFIQYVDDDEIQCIHCILNKGVNQKGFYIQIVRDNLNIIQTCVERFEESNTKFREGLKNNNEYIKIKKPEEEPEEVDTNNVLDCGCIDICRNCCE